MRRNPTWILALVTLVAMLAGAWYALRPRETLTILTLLQRKYENKPVAAFIDDGILLALEEVGHRAGRFRLIVAPRDIQPAFDTYLGPDEAVKEAAENPDVVAIIGPSMYHTGSIVARLNREGVLVVGPDDPDPELTKAGFGYSNYTPESYRPSGELNFFRTIPSEDVVERGCAEWAWKNGARTAFVLGDNENQIPRDTFLKTALRLGIVRVGDDAQDSGEYGETWVEKILRTNPDLVYLRGTRASGWAETLDEVRCLGWNGKILVRGDHADEWTPEGTVVISRVGPPAEFTRKFAARFGRPPGTAGWYGYLAASAVIESIDRARSKDRNEIRRACARLPLFDAHGDTLSNQLEVSAVREGSVAFLGTLVPSPPPPSPPKPRLTLSFQGTLREQRGILMGDMRATYYIDPFKIDADNCLSARELQDLQEGGHEIVQGAPPPGVVGPGKSLEELQAIVDRALTERKHVELLFHRIDSSDPGPDSITWQDFKSLCEYIHHKGFVVVPSRDARK